MSAPTPRRVQLDRKTRHWIGLWQAIGGGFAFVTGDDGKRRLAVTTKGIAAADKETKVDLMLFFVAYSTFERRVAKIVDAEGLA